MKWTKSPRIAMERLAEAHGYTFKSTGRGWQFANVKGAELLTFTAVAALCFMTRMAMAPLKWKGLGMSGAEVRELIRYRPVHHSWGRGLDIPAMAATDETTLYAAYFNPSTEDDQDV